MASQVLSGSSNPSYTNNTGQNVRILINYMASCTSMTWAGVTVTSTSTTVSKDNLQVETKQVSVPITGSISGIVGDTGIGGGRATLRTPWIDNVTGASGSMSTIAYVPTSIGPSVNLPVEVILAPSQSFSAVSGAYNIVVIKEDGT